MQAIVVYGGLPEKVGTHYSYEKLSPFYQKIDDNAFRSACDERGIDEATYNSLPEKDSRKQVVYERYKEIASDMTRRFHLNIQKLYES